MDRSQPPSKELRVAGGYILLLSAILTGTFASAQDHRLSAIHGTVVSADGVPVASAHVQLKKLRVSVLSDENGDFIFRRLPPITDTIVISSIELARATMEVTVGVGEKVEVGVIVLDKRADTLEIVEINGRQSSSYKSNFSVSATKIPALIKGIPQSISVVPAQLMADRMDYSLSDVMENVAGVNLFSDYEEYSIRGFRAENPCLINGLRTYNSSLVKPLLANVDRVEIVKGALSSLYGNVDPGGFVNLITKKPLAEKLLRVSVATGEWGDTRAGADISGPLNARRSVLFRFNGAYRNANSFRDQVFDKSFQLAPSLSYAPNSKFRLNVDLNVSRTGTVADRGQPGIRNSHALNATPIRLNLSQPGDYLRETDFWALLSLSYKVNQHISWNVSYLNYQSRQKLSEHTFGRYISDDSIYLSYTRRSSDAVTNNITNYAVFDFHTGRIKHICTAGYDVIVNNAELGQWNGELPDLFGSGSGIVGTFSLAHPQYTQRATEDYAKSAAIGGQADNDDAAKYLTQGAYIQDQISLGSWKFLLSARRESYSTRDGEQSAGNLRQLGLHENVFLPRIGVTCVLNDHVNVFGVWNRGFEPFEASANLPSFGGPFKPIFSQLLESGFKTEFFQKRLYSTISIYRIKQTNVLVNANDPTNPDRSVQAGSDVSKGLELEANGDLFSNLSLTVSYAHNVTKIVSGSSENVGKQEANAARHISGSWFRYHFKKGFARHVVIFAGHSQVSRRNTYSDVVLPGYCILNAGFGYNFKNIAFRCNFNNIGNKTYYEGGYNNINKWPGKPFNMMAEVVITL